MERQQNLFDFASTYLVGGVCASARIHPGLGRPFYVSRAEGSKVYDLDGREYIDLNTSFGATLLGHGHPRVKEAVAKALDLGIICSGETPYHAETAKKLVEMLPCADLVRFTGTGTEATYYAIKLAREYTGKEKIVKFEGHFHGFHDYLQYNCWPPVGEGLPKIYPEFGGVPKGVQKYVIVLPFNDLGALEETIKSQKDEIAGVILEPINYNSGGILPLPGYLESMRELTRENDVLLIFDEILSSFRTGPGCAQEYLGVTPDICTVGKAVGGGTPLSAFCGKREVMEHIAPLGNAQHSGTYNGNLIPVMAANAFLSEIVQEGFYDGLLQMCDYFYGELRKTISRSGVRGWLQATGARFNLLFGLDEEPKNYQMAAKRDAELTKRFFAAALRHGVYFHSAWHHGISAAHNKQDIERALEGIEQALREVA